ncbi:MAG: AAA family ATPase [Candidatus Midichloria sp.]|nr:AAA family ATPase [Candidatus Midichloria sp.]
MPFKSKIIAIANQKGGVGKTTTAINLATAFSVIGKEVLLLDLDPQGNASTGVNISPESRKDNIYNLMREEIDINHTVVPTEIPSFDIIPSTIDLVAVEVELINKFGKEFILKRKIKELKKNYDLIFIDCGPSLGLLTINALASADSVLIPLQSEFFALEGLAHLLNTVALIKQSLNPSIVIEGILLTMSDRRNRLSQQVESELREKFGDLVYESVIPRNVKLSEAPSHGKPAVIYDTKCMGSISYIMLAQEIMKIHKMV